METNQVSPNQPQAPAAADQSAVPSMDSIAAKMAAMREQHVRNQPKATEQTGTGESNVATEEAPVVPQGIDSDTELNEPEVAELEAEYAEGTEDGEAPQVEVSEQVDSPSEIIDFLGFGSNPSEINYHDIKEIQSAEKLARTIIDGYTMQTFGKYYGTQEQVGTGSDAIELVEKMISLDKVYENGLLVLDNTVSPAINTFGFPLEISPTGKSIRIVNTGWDVRYDNQVDPTVLYYGRFRDASRYKFTGTIGYKYVPEDIKIAAMLLVNDIIANDFNWRNKYLKKVDLSEISFEMHDGAFNGTGNIAVDNILDLYRNLNIVVI